MRSPAYLISFYVFRLVLFHQEWAEAYFARGGGGRTTYNSSPTRVNSIKLTRCCQATSSIEDNNSNRNRNILEKPCGSIGADRNNIALYSLQWTPDECISKPVRDLWKWKDSALGDGRDFFVPKPRTISKLQQTLLHQVPGLKEVSLLSNCARLELLCVWKESPSSIMRLQDISSCLLHQVEFYSEQKKSSFMLALTQSMDRPNVISDNKMSSETVSIIKHETNNNNPLVLELSRHWTCYETLPEILFHMCEISAGMAARPRRPDRKTVFRPFSSRDAHILLQLKRTKEVVAGTELNRILEYALRAGKIARNPLKVASLNQLKAYGDGSSKYSSSNPPLELSEQVKQDVLDQAIQPLIQECLEKMALAKRLSGNNNSDYSIQKFRQEAEAMATTPEEIRLVKRLLHQPTIEFRQDPSTVSVDHVLKNIQIELRLFRQELEQ